MRSGATINLETVKIGPSKCHVNPFEASYTSFDFTLLLLILEYIKCV